MQKMKFVFVVFLSVLVTACASEPLKAPCDQHATFCGTKTKINQW